MNKLQITNCTAIKEQTNMYEVKFSDGNEYIFNYDEIIKYALYEGSNSIAYDYNNLIFCTNVDRAFEKSLSFVLLRARTFAEVRKKLTEMEFEALVIEKVIEKLFEYKYIDDFDYCVRYIRTKNKLKYVSIKTLEFELGQKGVDNDMIINCIEECEIDEYSNAREILRKKSKNIDCIDNKIKQRLERLLYSKGFGFDVIKVVMEERILNDED